MEKPKTKQPIYIPRDNEKLERFASDRIVFTNKAWIDKVAEKLKEIK